MADSPRPRPARLPPRWFVRLAWSVHRGLYRVTRGRVGLWQPRPNGWGALRLTTTGRRTGRPRSVIIGYFEDGSNLVSMAMNGWGAGEPAWWLNLQANRDAEVEVAGVRRLVRAHAATGEERARLWARWKEIDRNLDAFAALRPTETAVVVLEPRHAGPGPTVNVGLDGSYRLCRAINREHGRTYYLATHLLPGWKRRHVHALYGFTRHTDDIVDGAADDPTRADRLRRWTDRFLAALDGAPVDDPVLPAVLHTIAVFDLDRADFVAFLRSMELDLTVDSYPTYDDLLDYMAGSAAAIGSMMLPILGATDLDTAREPARQLGLAFQLTNFIRDVVEDLDLGRIYLPLADLARFHVTPETLRARRATPAVCDLLAFEVGRARWHYARAAEGIPLLAPTSQACIRAAFRLYGGILDEVAGAGYDVFSRRAAVPNRRRVAGLALSMLTPPGRPVRRLPGKGAG